MKPGGSRSRAALSVGDGTLSGQVELVTGGTRGLGKEFVRALAAAGASLAVLSQRSGHGRRPHAVLIRAFRSVTPDQGS